MTDYDQIHRLIVTAHHARNQALAEMFADAMTWTAAALRRFAVSIAARIAHLKNLREMTTPSNRVAAASQR